VNRPALLVLVRHGQSERNIVKKRNSFYLDDESRKAVKGIPDHLIALTEEGHRQAIATGRALREQLGSFDDVFHSGYRRTIETTEGLLSAYSDEERARIVVRHHLFIRERDGGHTYDMTDAEAYEEADRRFNTEPMPNCAVTTYRLDPGSGRLRLSEAGQVFWRASGLPLV
jgi:broad specificity phosphatase PhoE